MAIHTPSPALLDAGATAIYAHLFQALADPTRLAVLQHLASGEHRVRDLVDHMGLAQSTVSKHLAFLSECGLVRVRPEGRASWYSLTETERLAEMVGAAERLLEATGTRAVLCSHLRAPHIPSAAGTENG
ncbi:metalloregulator ArsR/SmtB family transcription factor [Georgenia sp. 10Sc9-8]|uniref:Metalloregulator ArsR/SmtB family transcription factor n=1 Tax=Georgenia halotolerans TaxID=3028317 RepID=A0ABT5TXN9_9MICO|nr:metalloregulator ArsR/SmtB family transcription factor [Georgenia halotolerans]